MQLFLLWLKIKNQNHFHKLLACMLVWPMIANPWKQLERYQVSICNTWNNTFNGMFIFNSNLHHFPLALFFPCLFFSHRYKINVGLINVNHEWSRDVVKKNQLFNVVCYVGPLNFPITKEFVVCCWMLETQIQPLIDENLCTNHNITLTLSSFMTRDFALK